MRPGRYRIAQTARHHADALPAPWQIDIAGLFGRMRVNPWPCCRSVFWPCVLSSTRPTPTHDLVLPYHHRCCGGSVQHGLSVATRRGVTALFGGVEDKRYSLGLMSNTGLWLLNVLLVLGFAVRQLVRERLVAALLVAKSPWASQVSSWQFSGSIPGYAIAIEPRFVWGRQAAEIACIPGAAKYVWFARAIDLLQAGAVMGLVWSLYRALA